MTQAVVLVGGAGTRLRPLTDTRPKPMMALVDRPFVAHQIDLLRRHGIDDVVFSCGYRPDALRAHFGDRSAEGVRFRYVVDPEPLGTAGAIKNAEDLIDDAAFLVLNGDILTDLDLGAFAARHRETGASGTIALTPVEDPSAFGLVRLFDGRKGGGLRREARPRGPAARGALPHQRGHLPARAGRARPHPGGPRLLDRARGVPRAGGRGRALRVPERRLLARHRHARLVPVGRATTC